MHEFTFKGINGCLVEIAALLLKEGRKRITRGKVCYELPEPILIKIADPTSRVVTIHARKWNKYLPFAESLWIAGGCNDLEMISNYLPRMSEYSDDGNFIRGGYGPRIRYCNNSINDYKIQFPFKNKTNQISVDQFRFVAECFNRDIETRQAIITIGDPLKDCFQGKQLKNTKDFPCTRSLHFIKNINGKLDLHVHMRSNDFVCGTTGVNIFNYTFMLEYFSAILGLELGSYYHVVNNMHYYQSSVL